MTPTQAVTALLQAVPDALVVSSLGTATSALRAASDDGPHLYMGGAMGCALAVAVGGADHRPDRQVIALLGDGETVMGAGSLWTLAGSDRARVLAVVLADGRYTITGGQSLGVPGAFASVADALGLPSAVAVEPDEVAKHAAALDWPAVLEVRIDQPDRPGPSPFVDPAAVRLAFARAVAASG